MICPKCKSKISNDALFCGECGAKIEKEDNFALQVGNRVEKKENNKKIRNIIIIAGVVAGLILSALAVYFIFFSKDTSIDGIYKLISIQENGDIYTGDRLLKHTNNEVYTIELDEGKAIVNTFQKNEGTYEVDGNKITITVDDYPVSGTIEDDKIILREDENELIFQKTDKDTISAEDIDGEESIKLEKESITLENGNIAYIEANMDCTYVVKDQSICSVDSFGTVKGLKAGTTTVTCIADNKTKATCQITVKEKGIIQQQETYDVDEEVKKIRILYNEIQTKIDSLKKDEQNNIVIYRDNNQIKKIIKKADQQWNYTREYYYDNDQLYFVFIYGNKEEYRYYYKDDVLIRYIDFEKVVYDYGEIPSLKWDNELAQDKKQLKQYF